ncbi:MAG: hypothetical protein IT323_21940, partial [Anaerolineae bacterium]|nr:hypothetical protein [Anaerolineae bacterium]
GLALLAVGLAGGGYAVATALEEQDTFCISCHTAPEITYFNRAHIELDHPDMPAQDLSTAHYTAAKAAGEAPFRCIDCHRGDSSVGHRVAAIALGARDVGTFALGRDNPAIEKFRTGSAWLANASCATCHADSLARLDGINNHFHSYLPETRLAVQRGAELVIGDALRQVLADTPNPDPALTELHTVEVDVLCSDCHQAHHALLDGPQTFFIDETLRNQTCVTCHVAAGQGPQSVDDLEGE